MVLMNDFQKEYASIKDEIQAAIARVLESGWYILGKEVEAFEEEFAHYVGTKHCIGVASGLDALQISLMALGIGEGDEVLTVSNTAVATVLAITNTGATPIFVDVDEHLLLDPADAEAKITPQTKAIIPVHLFGQMADMSALQELAQKHQLHIVEDACQAHGAEQGGRKAGSLGQLGCFSFYPTKNLGAYGDAGAIVTNDDELANLCRMLRNYGQKNRYYHEIQGLNSRLDEIQAAILRVKLRHLPDLIEKRRRVAEQYIQQLSNIPQIKLPTTADTNTHAFHLFVIQAEQRDKLMAYLHEQEISALIHYPVPVHQQKCYEDLPTVTLPQTEQAAQALLSLPIHPDLTDEEVSKVSSAIARFYKEQV